MSDQTLTADINRGRVSQNARDKLTSVPVIHIEFTGLASLGDPKIYIMMYIYIYIQRERELTMSSLMQPRYYNHKSRDVNTRKGY